MLLRRPSAQRHLSAQTQRESSRRGGGLQLALQLLLRTGRVSPAAHSSLVSVPGPENIRCCRCGSNFRIAARGHTKANGEAASARWGKPANRRALARVVAEQLCQKPFLESVAWPPKHAGRRGGIAAVTPELVFRPRRKGAT